MRAWTAKRLEGYTESVFEWASALARQHDALNLGSGTPITPMPAVMRAAVYQAIADGHNQYSLVRGEAELRTAVAAHAGRFYGQDVSPHTEVTITSGVTEALHAALFSFVNPGDEVIVFEPFYDCYVPGIQLAGGTPVPVTLHAPSFRFNTAELCGAFSPRTRALILNSPHNPTGTVFSLDELELISELCQKFDVLAITDEVYEHIAFEAAQHIRLATLPGMWQRTLTLSGAGKSFACTGWRIGWAIGPAALQEALCRLRQFTVFSAATPLQWAIAAALEFPDAYFKGLAEQYQANRDVLLDALRACGLKPSPPAGGFFVLCDISAFGSHGRDFCTDMARNFGVVPIPLDTFYLNQDHGARIVRFTFCVPQAALGSAAQRLKALPKGGLALSC
jgi:aspartate/methionine/tyrosine aminotransferase